VLPIIPKDATDRNRTSPFAFTGNKFEFRAPGSSVCCAGPMTVLNTIVAEAVDRIASELEDAKVAGKAKPGEHTAAFHNALQKILQSSLKKHKRVVFNGNGYEADWPKEAEKRGLPNAPDTLSALSALSKKDNIALFEKYGVMTARELKSRHEIFLEEYEKKVRIEGNAALDIAQTMILPAVRAEYLETAKAYNETDSSNVKVAIDVLRGQMTELADGLVKMKDAISHLQDALKNHDTEYILAWMSELRRTADSLETIVTNEKWPLPKYRDMLFLY
jgi:glutamine synthetase